MQDGKPNLDWLLQHEIILSSRHRRFVSIVLVHTNGHDILEQFTAETIRSSDVCFSDEDGFAIVMADTENDEALLGILRLTQAVSPEMGFCYSSASFPSDGRTSVDVRRAAQRRMDRAIQIGHGAIISQD